MINALDQTGLAYFWSKITGRLATKADLVDGKVPTSQLPASSGGGVSSWNDLEDKPFDDVIETPAYSYTMPSTPEVVFPLDSQAGGPFTMYRVGDAVPYEMLDSASVTVSCLVDGEDPSTEQFSLSSSYRRQHQEHGSSVWITDDWMIVSACEDNYTYEDWTFQTAGLYCSYYEKHNVDSETGVETVATYLVAMVHKSPGKLFELPADRTGLATFAVGDATAYRVGDYINVAALDGASIKILFDDGSGSDPIVTWIDVGDSGTLVDWTAQGIAAGVILNSDNDMVCLTALEDNVTLGNGIVVPTSGIYLGESITDTGTITVQAFYNGVHAEFPLNNMGNTTHIEHYKTYRRTYAYLVAENQTDPNLLLGAQISAQVTTGGVSESSGYTSSEDTTESMAGVMVFSIDPETQLYGAALLLANIAPVPLGLYLIGGSITRLEQGSIVTTSYMPTSIMRDAQMGTRRLQAKYVEADWDHTINRPCSKEVLPPLMVLPPDYDTVTPTQTMTIPYPNVDGATMDVSLYRVSDALPDIPWGANGAIVNEVRTSAEDEWRSQQTAEFIFNEDILNSSTSDQVRLIAPFYDDNNVDYGWAIQLPGGLISIVNLIADNYVATLTLQGQPISVSINDAGLYFIQIYADLTEVTGGGAEVRIRPIGFGRDEQTIYHPLEPRLAGRLVLTSDFSNDEITNTGADVYYCGETWSVSDAMTALGVDNLYRSRGSDLNAAKWTEVRDWLNDNRSLQLKPTVSFNCPTLCLSNFASMSDGTTLFWGDVPKTLTEAAFGIGGWITYDPTDRDKTYAYLYKKPAPTSAVGVSF